MTKAVVDPVLRAVVGAVASVTAPPAFLVWRWVRHGASVRLRGVALPEGGNRLSVLAAAACYDAYRLVRRVAQVWRRHYTEFGLRFYAGRLAKHYAGLGHQPSQALSDEERRTVFDDLGSSRLAPFIAANPTVLDYRDGESFLDAGCGTGPELKALMTRYPTSPITGLDISAAALAVVQAGVRGNPLVQTRQLTLADPAQLASIADKSVDHVLLSHVIPYLMADGIEPSTRLRQTIVDHFVRIARRSVVVLTDRIERPAEASIEPVFENAALIRDDLPGYFTKHLGVGERYVLHEGPSNAALVLRLRAGEQSVG